MTNPNDNSELFEIFQNQMDLEEEQEKERKEQNDSDEEEESVDEDDEQKQQEAKKEKEEREQQKTAGKETDPNRSPAVEPNEPQTTESSSSSTSDSSGTQEQTTSQNAHPQAPSPPEQPETPSSTVAPEDESDPDTETGSFIKELEKEKELEGKIILSRGTSVFLLILVTIFVIGSYMLGSYYGQPSTTGQTQTGMTETKQNSDNTFISGSTNDEKSSPESPNNESENTKQRSPITNNQNNTGATENKSYYTFAIIGYSATESNVEKLIKKHIGVLRNEANLDQVGYLPAKYSPNNQHWIVAGVLNERKDAENLKQEVRSRLDRTQHAKSYNADIIKLSSKQRENIRFPN